MISNFSDIAANSSGWLNHNKTGWLLQQKKLLATAPTFQTIGSQWTIENFTNMEEIGFIFHITSKYFLSNPTTSTEHPASRRTTKYQQSNSSLIRIL